MTSLLKFQISKSLKQLDAGEPIFTDYISNPWGESLHF